MKRLYVKTLNNYDQIETNEINGDQLKLNRSSILQNEHHQYH